MKAFPWAGLVLLPVMCGAQERIEMLGMIDGTDQVVIRQEGAVWGHVFGDLEATQVQVNGVGWSPSVSATLENAGETMFLTNRVNWLAARLEVLEGRDTVVLQRGWDHIRLSFADTPEGPANYHVVVNFPESPTLLVEAEIDGSDELRVSFAGAEWEHRHWGPPLGNVRLNGVEWDVSANPVLPNAGERAFLSDPVNFANAVVLEQSGRDLLTVQAAEDGVTINFADNPLGAGSYRALIAFPPAESVGSGVNPMIAGAEIGVVSSAAISIETVRGIWYELERSVDVSGGWESTGMFAFGNGGMMTMVDPMGIDVARFYRVVARAERGN